MKLDNPGAFVPLMDRTIVVKINAGHKSEDILTMSACVRVSAPDGATTGLSSNSEKWTVTLKESDWLSPRPATRGTIIEEDKINFAYPKLTVQHVNKLGGLIVFECSANELAPVR